MKRLTVLPVLLCVLAAGSIAYAILGQPFAAEVITGTTVQTKGVTATLCKVGSSETGALAYIASNSIYYSLASTPATHGYAGAVYMYAATGDIIELSKPSAFRILGTTTGVTWNVMVSCFVR